MMVEGGTKKRSLCQRQRVAEAGTNSNPFKLSSVMPGLSNPNDKHIVQRLQDQQNKTMLCKH